MSRIYLTKDGIYKGNLILVNEDILIHENAIPGLKAVSGSDITLRYTAALHLETAMTEINGWSEITPVSGYRSLAEQQKIWDDSLNAKYGFILRYPFGKEHITKIAYEPWHFRYVGAPHAEIIEKNDFVLEEYIEYIKQFMYWTEPLVFRNEYEISYLAAGNYSFDGEDIIDV